MNSLNVDNTYLGVVTAFTTIYNRLGRVDHALLRDDLWGDQIFLNVI